MNKIRDFNSYYENNLKIYGKQILNKKLSYIE